MINVTLYIKKAYDSVDRNKLYWKLIKLQKFSIRDTKLIAHLIENNKYTLCSNKATSLVKTASIGPPKGSIISPKLFNIFIDDIIHFIQKRFRHMVFLYAVDILICPPTVQIAQNIILGMERHSTINNYRFNPDKCYYNTTKDISIKVYNTNFTKQSPLKYLCFFFINRGAGTADTGIEGHNRIRIINKETGGNNKETTTDLSGNSQPGNTRIPSKEHIENIKVSKNNKAFMDIKAVTPSFFSRHTNNTQEHILLIKNESSEDDNTEKESRAINDNNEEEKNKVVEGDKNILNTKWDIKNSKVTKESDAVDTTRLAMIEDKLSVSRIEETDIIAICTSKNDIKEINTEKAEKEGPTYTPNLLRNRFSAELGGTGYLRPRPKITIRIREKPISLSQPRNTEELKRITNEDGKDYDISTEGLEGLIRYSERLEPRLKNEDKCKEQMKYKTEVAITSKNKEHKPIMNISYRLNNTKLNKEQKILITQGNLHLQISLYWLALETMEPGSSKDVVNMVFLSKTVLEVICKEGKKEAVNRVFRNIGARLLKNSPEVDSNGLFKISGFLARMKRIKYRRSNNNYKLRRLAVKVLKSKGKELHKVIGSLNIKANDIEMDNASRFINVGGLSEIKTFKINNILRQYDLEVLGIAETWSHDIIPIVKGYNILGLKKSLKVKDRYSNKESMIVLRKIGLECDTIEKLLIKIPYAIFPIEDSTQRARRLRGNIAHKIINSRKTLLRHISNQQTMWNLKEFSDEASWKYKAHMKLVVTGDNYHLEGGVN
ncbi:putative reverse transcriptase [Hamiltosporidium magnivora]|uniref:Putative reverse transcriptase n=1 Tax=Hamiltosporidium magnivora TaxID=148818 RepID=A0A4Q9LMF9_9MICR|nr:putative reverse transcriptase [Hamiltosporidium magnivora]